MELDWINSYLSPRQTKESRKSTNSILFFCIFKTQDQSTNVFVSRENEILNERVFLSLKLSFPEDGKRFDL